MRIRQIGIQIEAVGRAAQYNALGQRVRKTTGAGTTVLLYDESGHLMGEYDGAGNAIEEIIWLGDIPVTTVRQEACGLSIFYIHTDHLNTPRRITRRSTSDVVWSWDSDQFGATAANENPSGLGSFSFNLRFPGQYYDAETGLSYNYFRDFDPAVGRYVESDPIGLRGGINTYAYVGGNPLSNRDRTGLAGFGGLGGNISWQEAQALSLPQFSVWDYLLDYLTPPQNVGVSATIPSVVIARVPTVLSIRFKQSSTGGSCTIGWGPGISANYSMRYSDQHSSSGGDSSGWGASLNGSLPLFGPTGRTGSYANYFNGGYSGSYWHRR